MASKRSKDAAEQAARTKRVNDRLRANAHLLGVWADGSLETQQDDSHSIVVGGTRAGKGSCIADPENQDDESEA